MKLESNEGLIDSMFLDTQNEIQMIIFGTPLIISPIKARKKLTTTMTTSTTILLHMGTLDII